ncbi:MAG: cupin domain-containing protein [Treponema sp.]|jgi:mannose-6-phosphate isomerase-like protein (cupin superfamily)|nr:cupin domain-containing protein [Treponema sp.]
MVIRRQDMKVELKEKMRDGEGTVQLIHLLDAGGEKNARMFAEITLKPGCSIGYHQHNSETEYFFIISGTGTVKDDGKEVQVKQGDSIITGNGAFHSIKNTGTEPLVFHAVIVTYS